MDSEISLNYSTDDVKSLLIKSHLFSIFKGDLPTLHLEKSVRDLVLNSNEDLEKFFGKKPIFYSTYERNLSDLATRSVVFTQDRDIFWFNSSFADESHKLSVDMWSNKASPEAEKTLKRVLDKVAKYDAPENRDDSEIPVTFWHQSINGPRKQTKMISCPSFEEIKENYSREAIEDVLALGAVDNITDLGKIIILKGPPGTGKTHFIRALLRDWVLNKKAVAEVVLDANTLLSSAEYIQDMLLSSSELDDVFSSTSLMLQKIFGKDDQDLDSKNIIRLIILEDCAEIFAESCRNNSGFSRLLNLTDGIMGQGLNCIFILSTNEETDKLDPAIIRDGRCIKTFEFPLLTEEASKNWAKENDCLESLPKDKTEFSLAELYKIKKQSKLKDVLPSNRSSSKPKDKFGFAP